jgi:DNA processing protein
MKVEQETMYAAALQSLKGCGSRRLQALLDVCRSPSQAWGAVWDEDLRRRTGIPAKIFSQLRQERDVFDWDTFQRRLSFYGVRPVALWDDDYPSWLPFIAQPPLVLFCQGTMERDSSSIAIVGSRKASPYGLNAAETLAAELAAQGLTIVSGGARGIDTRAHRGALKRKGRTVVVAANGLDRTYPRENKALFRQVVDSGGTVRTDGIDIEHRTRQDRYNILL